MVLGGFQSLIGLVACRECPNGGSLVFMLIQRNFAIDCDSLVFYFYFINLVDAKRVAVMRKKGKRSNRTM